VIAGEFGVEKLRPAGVMVEVAGDERDVEVARLADGLAVVHRFQHGQQARVALHDARERVEVPRAAVAAECLPCGKGLSCRPDRRVDVLLGALGDVGDALPRCRVHHLERRRRLRPLAVDEVAEAAVVLVEPLLCRLRRLGSGTVLHGIEDLAH
jgi:hypothetical protein